MNFFGGQVQRIHNGCQLKDESSKAIPRGGTKMKRIDILESNLNNTQDEVGKSVSNFGTESPFIPIQIFTRISSYKRRL